MKRRAARYRVCVSVVYEVDGDARRASVENLSRFGLFVSPGLGLEAGTELEVDIEFPGAEGTHRCQVRVAHRLAEDDAHEQGRRAGVGLELASTTPAFQDALGAYLARLGRRGDALVWACDEGSGLLLSAAGFHVESAPDPDDMAAALAASPRVLALVASATRSPAYATITGELGRSDLIVTMNGAADVDSVLSLLDLRL